MVSSDKKFSDAVGAKSVRACDNCIKKRARWYCAADDAFLCQSCDLSVHSANPLARRHQRVRLKIASSVKPLDDESLNATWHQGFTRKARTPRQKKNSNRIFNHRVSSDGDKNNHPLHLVPEICSEENSLEENEEHELLYRVPIFDPFVAELCTSANSNEGINNNCNQGFGHESKHVSNNFNHEMSHFLPSEMDLAEFAADVESLLGNGLENETFDMEGLGLLDRDDVEKDEKESSRVKIEDEEIGEVVNNHEGEGEFIDLGRETFELSFDYDAQILGEEEDNKGLNLETHDHDVMVNNFEGCDDRKGFDSKKIFLRLDYEGVMSAWDDQKSPWTTGERPDLDSGECWPDCVGTCGTMHVYGEMGMTNAHHPAMADGGREARVSRYREKRRTRLFSKKIRYEVRKLNAEKRPRMKGRFVKRANFVAPSSSAFSLISNK